MQRIGEPTELALRVFAEKVGLPSAAAAIKQAPSSASSSNAAASQQQQQQLRHPGEFVVNGHWAEAHPRIGTLEFSRDRKMMSVLAGADPEGSVGGKAPQHVLWTKVCGV